LPLTLSAFNSEMARLGINVLGISETRWPGEDDYKSDGFRIIHSGGEESQRGLAILLHKRTANCVEKVWCEGDRLLMVVKLKGELVRIVHHPSIYAMEWNIVRKKLRTCMRR